MYEQFSSQHEMVSCFTFSRAPSNSLHWTLSWRNLWVAPRNTCSLGKGECMCHLLIYYTWFVLIELSSTYAQRWNIELSVFNGFPVKRSAEVTLKVPMKLQGLPSTGLLNSNQMMMMCNVQDLEFALKSYPQVSVESKSI